MQINVGKAIKAGILGTVTITFAATILAPLMGLPKMDIPGMLAGVMGGSVVLGWAAHFMIGTVLAFGYALFGSKLPGPAVLRGAIYSLAPWLLAQVMVMPMMGMGFFSGAFAPAFGSLLGHLMYGAVVGVVYCSAASCCSSNAARKGCCG